jgi:hypothetical protein
MRTSEENHSGIGISTNLFDASPPIPAKRPSRGLFNFMKVRLWQNDVGQNDEES